MKNFNPKVQKVNGNNKDGYSVLLADTKNNFCAWMDAWISDSEINTDWNAYIFDVNDSNDMHQKEMQADCEVFDVCVSLVVSYLEETNIIINKNDKWEYVC